MQRAALCIDNGMTNTPRKKPLPASLLMGNFIQPSMINTVAELQSYITAQAQTLDAVPAIETEQDAINVINIVTGLKDILNNERIRPLVRNLPEDARKKIDDVFLTVMTPESLPYTRYDNQGTEIKLRKLALATLLQGLSVDARGHHSRLGFSEIVLDVTFGMLRSNDIKDTIKQAFVQTLLDQPRIDMYAQHLARELHTLDKTPPYTDYDGRPYPNHWARDALITLSDMVHPGLTRPEMGLRSGGTKPTRTPG